MRTTVTIDADVAAGLDDIMRAKKISFKKALNDVLRRGLSGPQKKGQYRLKSAPLKLNRGVEITLRLADEMENAELVRKMQMRK